MRRYIRMENKKENMETMRAYKFRIYPDTKRQAAIDDSISMSQRLYNKLLEKTIEVHKSNPSSKISQRTVNQFLNEIIKEDKAYLQLYAHIRVDIRNRLLKTYQNFFRRCQQKRSGAKIKAGFPRFKSRDKFNSITYIENNGSFRIEKDRLRVSKISGTIRTEIHRSIEGKIKTMTIAKEGKKYYAIFTAVQHKQVPETGDTNPVGIDVGLDNFVALSNGETFRKPKFFKKSEKRIARWQSIVARRDKGSKRRQKAKEKLSNNWKSVTNKSDDFMHKLSAKLANGGFTSFAVEDLQIQNMEKNHTFAQSIQNASWNRFIQFLTYKAQERGKAVIKVNPNNTSKQCSNCGNIQEMPLSERTFNCNGCRLQLDRDINASINIPKRATLGQRGSHAQGENRQYHAAGIASGLGELRTDPANAGEANDL